MRQETVKALTQDEVKAVFAVADRWPIRDRVLIRLIYRFAMRVSEALALTPEDIDLKRGEIRITALKRRSNPLTRTFAIPKDLQVLLRKYRPSGAFLFVSRERKRLSRTQAWRTIKDILIEAGIDRQGVGPHSLRHSLAVHMLDSGLQLEHVKDALRHSSIRSSEVYGNISAATRIGYSQFMDRSSSIVKVR
jgi:integrase/recombinase XerD